VEKEAQLVEDNSSLKDQLEELASMQDTMIEDLATCRAEQLKGAAEIETLQGLVQTYEEAAVQKSNTIASLEEDLAKSCSDLEEVDCKLKDTINKNTEEVKTTDDALALPPSFLGHWPLGPTGTCSARGAPEAPEEISTPSMERLSVKGRIRDCVGVEA